MSALERETAPNVLVGVAVVAIVAGGLVGATTNAVNGCVSPTYFRTIMRWDDVRQIWRASVAQGVFEGLVLGTLVAIVFTLVVGVATRARCRFREVAPTLAAIVFGVMVCWAIGGVLAIGLATLSPEFYQRAFRGVPDDFGEMIRYAWVGGSIWGAQVGAVLCLVIGSTTFANQWRRNHA